jgi:hypothetical protein
MTYNTWIPDWLLHLFAWITNHNKSQSIQTVSSTAQAVHLDQLQQLLLSIAVHLNVPLGPTGPTLLPAPTKRLGWLGS